MIFRYKQTLHHNIYIIILVIIMPIITSISMIIHPGGGGHKESEPGQETNHKGHQTSHLFMDFVHNLFSEKKLFHGDERTTLHS